MTNKICKISLFSAILACVSAVPGDAAVKTNNASRSYAGAYQQVNNLRAQQEYFNTTTNAAVAQLPVMVDDEKLANSIVNNESGAPTMSELEACAMIYPNGNFKWGIPEYGIQREPQCIAVVELRDANTNAILAYTTVAAGQSIKCNIDYFTNFNESALSNIKELPADAAPTMEDVIAVMNEEQKQNAGLKIAAGAIIAGVAGNLLAQKDATKTNDKIPVGTGKSQLVGTAVGVAAGAGIMAASSYSGKVAGDTIKSTAVNATSGMLVGNMLAGANGGSSVIATTKCSVDDSKTEHDCVVGKYETYGELKESSENKFYIISKTGELRECTEKSEKWECKIQTYRVGDIKLTQKNDKNSSISWNDKEKKKNELELWEPGEKDIFTESTGNPADNSYYKIKEARVVTDTQRAYAIFESGTLKKPMGYTDADWAKDLMRLNPKIYIRYSDGSAGKEIPESTVANFKPSSRDADDGGLIDLSNPARAKGTIVGTAAGGALGGFAGYQGAKDEISERWVSASREYEDSLTNFICTTGNRFLSQYNSYAEIPTLKTDK